MPVAGPGERLWVLDVPYGTQVDGATWHPAVRTHLHVGRALPAHLEPYAPGPWTLGRFIENTLNPDSPDTRPGADRRARAAADPVRGGRRDRGARRGGRTGLPARRRAGRGQDDLRGPRGDGGGRPPRGAAGARRGRPARRDHHRPLVPHHHRARQRRTRVGGDHVGPAGQGRGPRLGRDHRRRGPRAAAYDDEAVEAVGADLRAREAARPRRRSSSRPPRRPATRRSSCPTSPRRTPRCWASR